MTDGLHGTDVYTTCPECGCVSGRVGEEYVARHRMTCSRCPDTRVEHHHHRRGDYGLRIYEDHNFHRRKDDPA